MSVLHTCTRQTPFYLHVGTRPFCPLFGLVYRTEVEVGTFVCTSADEVRRKYN